MRVNFNLESQGAERRPPILLDAAHLGRLRALASSNLHGVARLARLLREQAERIRVVPAGEMPADVVNFGSEVTYVDQATGQQHTIIVVLPHEADIPARRVSVVTPVGTALIGRRQGAVVACEFPVGKLRPLTIRRVRSPGRDHQVRVVPLRPDGATLPLPSDTPA